MVSEAAKVTLQLRVLVCPGEMTPGDAVNATMAGGRGPEGPCGGAGTDPSAHLRHAAAQASSAPAVYFFMNLPGNLRRDRYAHRRVELKARLCSEVRGR